MFCVIQKQRVWLIGLAFLLSACGESPQIEIQGATMGTTYSVKLPRAPESLEQATLKQEIDALLANINAEMSTYDPRSKLSLFNASATDNWQPLPARLMRVLAAASEINALSDGAFDPSIGPLVNLWGFGPESLSTFPSAEAINTSKQQVGFKQLVMLDVREGRAKKKRNDVYIDLSAIAKGFAVDEVASLLLEHSVKEYLVEIGGEIRVAGKNQDSKLWRVAVENPSVAGRSVHGVLSVTDKAVATSGDYRNFFEHEGKRYSHTIDPRTGYPVDHNLVSVTVVDESAMRADALATALTVMGAEAGMQLAQKHNLAVWFIIRKDDQWIDLYSPTIENYRVN